MHTVRLSIQIDTVKLHQQSFLRPFASNRAINQDANHFVRLTMYPVAVMQRYQGTSSEKTEPFSLTITSSLLRP